MVGKSKTRGNNLKETGEIFKRNPRSNLFTYRVVDIWSKLPVEWYNYKI